MFPFYFQPVVAVEGGVGCFLSIEGRCQDHPKWGDLPWCWEEPLEAPT